MLFNHNREQTVDTHNNLDESPESSAEGEWKPTPKGYILYDFTHITYFFKKCVLFIFERERERKYMSCASVGRAEREGDSGAKP